MSELEERAKFLAARLVDEITATEDEPQFVLMVLNRVIGELTLESNLRTELRNAERTHKQLDPLFEMLTQAFAPLADPSKVTLESEIK